MIGDRRAFLEKIAGFGTLSLLPAAVMARIQVDENH